MDGHGIRAIAFYLPQFHPIPQNDQWWGAGFTEWTNVAKARPLYPGHVQPILPSTLGFYDLRVPEVREKQAALAREAGLEAFCYWHYWFDGDQLLQRPFDEVLASGQPDFGFCLGWANASWTGVWWGAPGRLLIRQTYSGTEDHIRHFESLTPAFFDHRYMTIDGSPVFIILNPMELPEPARTLALWRCCAEKSGLPGLFVIGIIGQDQDPRSVLADGFDGYLVHPSWQAAALRRLALPKRAVCKLATGPLVGRYTDLTAVMIEMARNIKPRQFPVVVPGWDNTPRTGRRGIVLAGKSPEQFAAQVRVAIEALMHRRERERLLFVKSWNEWAEGNHLEPDSKWGHAFIQSLDGTLRRYGEQSRALV
ncbi:MAG: glycosyltransferase WbsX family protein [Acidimicrobiales bacterium]